MQRPRVNRRRVNQIALGVVVALIAVGILRGFTLIANDAVPPPLRSEFLLLALLLACLLFIAGFLTVLAFRPSPQPSSSLIVESEPAENNSPDMRTTRPMRSLDSSVRRAIQLQVAAEIARDATATLDLDIVLNRAVELVRDRFGFYHAGIFLVDEMGEYAILQAAAGPSREQLLAKRHRLKVGQTGIVGYVTGTGLSRIAQNVGGDEVHYKNPDLPNTRSELTLPLKVGQQVIGALDVQSVQENAFDDEDVTILQILADLLAVAIDHAHLFNRVQEYATELEQRVESRTAELTQKSAQLQAILDSMVDGLIYTVNGVPQYGNAAFRHLTGYTLDEWALLMKRELDSGHWRRIVSQSPHVPEIWTNETRITCKDGSEMDVSLTSARVLGPDNETQGVVTLIRDISKEKALQAQKARFVANASHELRTPITNLKTRLFLLRKQPERFDEHLRIIEHVANRMQNLVEQLLDITRFERGAIRLEKEMTDINGLVNDVIEVQRPEAEKKQITLLTELPPTPILILIDAERMIQVVTNLVTNAINYTPPEGNIVVRLYTDETSDEVVIEVQDNGPGIAPEAQDLIFQPFFRVDTTKTIGTGLGLSISREIVELHGGTISLQSEVNQGTTFHIRLPHKAHQKAHIT